jgi:hypothetical protein
MRDPLISGLRVIVGRLVWTWLGGHDGGGLARSAHGGSGGISVLSGNLSKRALRPWSSWWPPWSTRVRRSCGTTPGSSFARSEPYQIPAVRPGTTAARARTGISVGAAGLGSLVVGFVHVLAAVCPDSGYFAHGGVGGCRQTDARAAGPDTAR